MLSLGRFRIKSGNWCSSRSSEGCWICSRCCVLLKKCAQNLSFWRRICVSLRESRCAQKKGKKKLAWRKKIEVSLRLVITHVSGWRNKAEPCSTVLGWVLAAALLRHANAVKLVTVAASECRTDFLASVGSAVGTSTHLQRCVCQRCAHKTDTSWVRLSGCREGQHSFVRKNQKHIPEPADQSRHVMFQICCWGLAGLDTNFFFFFYRLITGTNKEATCPSEHKSKYEHPLNENSSIYSKRNPSNFTHQQSKTMGFTYFCDCFPPQAEGEEEPRRGWSVRMCRLQAGTSMRARGAIPQTLLEALVGVIHNINQNG